MGQRCGFFEWADGGQSQGPGNGQNRGRGRGLGRGGAMPRGRGGSNTQARVKRKKCGVCHQEGRIYICLKMNYEKILLFLESIKTLVSLKANIPL